MKKLFTIALILMLASTVFAQKSFFPTHAGTKLTYQTYDKKDKVSGTIKYIITDVKGSGDEFDITYKVESLDEKENQVFIDEITVRQRGDTMYFDMSNFLNKAAFQQDGQISPSIEVTGNNLEMPIHLQAGMTLPDASVTMAMKMGFMNLKMTANVTNRNVEAEEDVTVKGGSFKAFKISSDVNSSILGVKVNSRGIDWYAYGIGVVRNESYDKKGQLQSSMELIEIQE